MKHGSLFSGIGGFDLAAEQMGWQNVFHCEWNEFGRKVLKHHFPKSISYENIIETDFTIHRGTIDIITGGFPCQPYSTAGKRKGKDDERHLWPEMLRCIREVQPRWIVGENVRGIVSWNGGLVFEEICFEMEAEGYEVQPFILPACGVNAPHRRDRVWFIAHSNKCNDRRKPGRYKGKSGEERLQERNEVRKFGESGEIFGNATDTDSIRSQRRSIRHESKRWGGPIKEQSKRQCEFFRQDWEIFPTQPPVCGGNDGISEKLDSITFPKWRSESIKAYGNAIVPQVVLQIFKAIEEYETNRHGQTR